MSKEHRSAGGNKGRGSQSGQGKGTPIFDEDAASRKGPGAEAREIAREQGQQPPTPQRDHERERSGRQPNSASSRPREENTSGVKHQAGGVQSGSDEDMPLRPPGGHGESANIDDAHDPR
jgi:hypothetical protein